MADATTEPNASRRSNGAAASGSARPARKTAPTTSGPTAGAAADVPARAESPERMTPAAALARHLEWLDFALAAARAEAAWRQGRLDKASKRNRAKRQERLAEVNAEVVELSALIEALAELRRRPARAGSGRKAATGSAARKPAVRRAASKPAAKPTARG